jgi:hypothetical protein
VIINRIIERTEERIYRGKKDQKQLMAIIIK